MLTRYVLQGPGLVSQSDAALNDTLWIDLFEPTPEEERQVEIECAIDVPTREEMREIMTRGVGVVRTEASLADAQAGLARLEQATPDAAWRTHRQLSVAQLITKSARGRRESQGSHRRADFPPRPARQSL